MIKRSNTEELKKRKHEKERNDLNRKRNKCDMYSEAIKMYLEPSQLRRSTKKAAKTKAINNKKKS